MPDNDDIKIREHATLWCTLCHTRWAESCFSPGAKCPFTDCVGTLSTVKPSTIRKQTRTPRDKTLPLFDAPH